MRYAVDVRLHEAIFGKPDRAETPGRSRMCRFCGNWHRLDRPWPHNCREPAPPRSSLAAPRIAPKFDPFVAGTHDAPEIINDHADKRSYMDKHDLVEWDEGITPPADPTPREWVADFVEDFKRAEQTDPLNRPPLEIIGQTDTEGAGEIDTTVIEVAK